MAKAYYKRKIGEFLLEDNKSILGKLHVNDEFETTTLQNNAWEEEIEILKDELAMISSGDIIFEYTIPRIGTRIDVVLIIKGIVFLLEFKCDDNKKNYMRQDKEQVMDYALDLKYFHEESSHIKIIPILVVPNGVDINNAVNYMQDNIADVLCCNKENIGELIGSIIEASNEKEIDRDKWINSRYAPTPTIIEAAQSLYRNHSVESISRSGAQNLAQTTKAINKIIEHSKIKRRKAICFVTGVPGAGKTLAGLNIANSRHDFDEDEHAVFLSGNEPLVDVLRSALARDRAERDNISIRVAEREIKPFIQIIHKFRDELLDMDSTPKEKVAIFDEAQRAWDKEELGKFMRQKKHVRNFDMSEPEFLIGVMDRHQDWATIVCLIGGGQEIKRGESGIIDWLDALTTKYKNWDIYISDQMTDFEFLGDNNLENLLGDRKYNVIPELHLSVSLRTFRSKRLSDFVKEMLDNNVANAQSIYKELKETYPVVVTRDIEVAKKWVKEKARGSERYGLLASSEGKRLRANGIWVLKEIDHVGWFLNDKDHVNSSFYLEVAASEFKVQGLEIDWGILAWDVDLRYENRVFSYHQFWGNRWRTINDNMKKRNIKNAYRVLLTRARQGLVIYVPAGNDMDHTTQKKYYDGVYNYLREIGVEEI